MIALNPWHERARRWLRRRALRLMTGATLVVLTVVGVLVSADNSTYGWWIHTRWGPYAVAILGVVGLVGTVAGIVGEATVGELQENARNAEAGFRAELQAAKLAYDELSAKSSAELKRLRKENREFFDRNLNALYDSLGFDRRDRITAYEIRIVERNETFHEIARYSVRELYGIPGNESPPHHHRLLAASLEQANNDDPCDARWFVEDLTDGVKGSEAWCKRMNEIFGIDPNTAEKIEMKSRTLYAYCVGDDTSATTILLFESVTPKRFAPHEVRNVTTEQRELIRYLAQHRPPLPEGPLGEGT